MPNNFSHRLRLSFTEETSLSSSIRAKKQKEKRRAYSFVTCVGRVYNKRVKKCSEPMQMDCLLEHLKSHKRHALRNWEACVVIV